MYSRASRREDDTYVTTLKKRGASPFFLLSVFVTESLYNLRLARLFYLFPFLPLLVKILASTLSLRTYRILFRELF